jgi:hypothetical protein
MAVEPMEPESDSNQLGFCALASISSDNAVEELYYLEMNYDKNTVNYQHKIILIMMKAILRTSFETTKKIKQIRNLLI